MRISHKRKFVFLSNPKCGSSSIRRLLNPVTDIKGEDHPKKPLVMMHIHADALKSYFEHEDYKGKSVDSWDNYYKFTTIRNPFKKMVSQYFFSRPDKDFLPYYHPDHDATSPFRHGFNDWLKHTTQGHGLPSYNYFCCDHSSGELLLDKVFKIEEINEVLPSALLENCGLEIESIPHLNPDYKKSGATSRHMSWNGDYYQLYNKKSISIIEDLYSSDLETFNYEFGQ
jgi:hypothetical protein